MTFGALFTQVLGFFNGRFQVTYLLPSFIFWALLVVVWFAGQGNIPAATSLWSSASGTHWIVVVGFFAGLVIFANILASQSTSITRLYEGYWDFPGGRKLRSLGTQWHRNKLGKLDPNKAEEYLAIYLFYPLPTQQHEVMPTRLGNILKNSERYSYDRYELDAVVIWPRLYSLFPAEFGKAVVELRTGLDFMLVISLLSFVFGVLSGGYLLIVGAPPKLFALCFGGGIVAGWITYQGALGNAILYAQQIKVGFDLYRNELLKQMRIALPKNQAEERETWAAVRQLLYQVVPPEGLSYVDKTES
jgi:hypothetical protein